MSSQKGAFTEVISRYKNTPKDIKLIALFSICIVVLSKLMRLDNFKSIYESIIPYTGWAPGMIYGGIIFCIFIGIGFVEIQKSVQFTRLFILALLTLAIIIGIVDWINADAISYTSTNPYIQHKPYRQIFLLVIPFSWMLLIGINTLKTSRNNK